MPYEGLGMRIKALRQKKGWTQVELAQRAGMSAVYLGQIEGSATKPPSRTPSYRTLRQLASALEMTVGELVD